MKISSTRKKLFKNGKLNITGGNTKWYIYKNIKIQGTYELKTCYILENLKNKQQIKNWEYTNDKFEYIGTDGKKHTYLIDFKIFRNDGSFYYLEVKGRVQDKDYLKWQTIRNNGYELEIWFKDKFKEFKLI